MLPANVSGTGYGGWINLDLHENQFFSCVPGSHNEKFAEHNGFVKFSKEDMARYKFKERKQSIVCPPGHWIVFRQRIIHEIVAKPRDTVMRRLFVGFRTTTKKSPAFKNDQIITKQGVPKLPSGQTPPMYAALHWTNWIDQLVKWSNETFDPKLLVTRERAGKKVTTIPRFMSSLEELKLPMYPAYSAEEKALFSPAREFDVLDVNWDDLNDVSSYSRISMD